MFLVLSITDVRWAVYGALATLVLPFTVFNIGVPIDTRFLSAPFVSVLVAKAVFDNRRAAEPPATGTKVLAAAAGVGFVTALWSGRPSETLAGAIALLNAGALVWALSRVSSPGKNLRVVRRFLTALALASVVWGSFPVGTLGGRLRGVMLNPNALGIVVLFLVPLLFTSPRRGWAIGMGGACLYLLARSGSRSAAIAILAECLIGLRFVRRGGIRATVVTIAIVAMVGLSWQLLQNADPVAAGGVSDGKSITRRVDSRSEQWTDALAVFRSHPLTGIGYGDDSAEAANSYLKLLAESGLFALAVAIPTCQFVATTWRQGRPVLVALLIGGLVSAVFESWLFVGGSFFSIVFWIAIMPAGTPKPVRVHT
jgi:hypothetical protein